MCNLFSLHGDVPSPISIMKRANSVKEKTIAKRPNTSGVNNRANTIADPIVSITEVALVIILTVSKTGAWLAVQRHVLLRSFS